MSKSKFNWKDDHILFIIDQVKTAEYVWNHNNISYKNKSKKQIFWNKVVEGLNENFKFDGVFTYSEVLKKWNNTKTYFSSESQKHFKTAKSGAATDDVRNLEESTWRFYEKLMFLKETCEIMPSVNNYNKISLNELSRNSEAATDSLIENPNVWQIEYLDSDDHDTMSYFRSIQTLIETITINELNYPSTSRETINSPNIDMHDVSSAPYHPRRITSPSSIDYDNSSSQPSTSSRFHTSTPNTDVSQPKLVKPKPLHPNKKARISAKSKDELLAESCLQSSQEIANILKSRQLKYQSYGDYIAQDLERFDIDLLNLARHRINNVLFGINEMQNQRDNENKNKNNS